MTSTFERTEPSFSPARPLAPQAAPEATQGESPSVWPWAAAALCAALFALPSALAVPQRLAVEAQRAAALPALVPPVAAPGAAVSSGPGRVGGAAEDTLVTGAITAAASMPAAASTLRVFGVRLAGGESADLLWTHWSELKARFPGVLDAVGTTVRPLPGQASPQRFELMAGRFRNAAEAASLCGRLRAHDIPCAVKDLEEVPAAPL